MATRWGICGAGKISDNFTVALKKRPAEDHQVVAVAARKLEDAQEFANKHSISRVYGSYEELARDPDMGQCPSARDIVHVGVIPPYHLNACKLFINAKKNVLCEKSLAMNTKELKEILDSAKKNNVFLMEAVWTRFFQASVEIRNLLAQEYIGEVKMVRADYSLPLLHMSRSDQKDLSEGALLGLGIYCLQFISMVYKGEKPESIQARGVCLETGVDETVAVILRYSKNRMATFTCSAGVELHSEAIIIGTEGKIQVLSPMWCPTSIIVDRKETEYPIPERCLSLNFTYSTGKRYEVEEVRQCLLKGLKESPVMSHAYTLLLAEMGDEICRQVGGVYSQDYQRNMATRWGICSAGKISHDFTVALKTLPAEDHQVVAVAARKLEDAQEFSRKHNISKAYGSYEELARDPDVDVVYVGVVHPCHLNACKLFINAKKNVLCEKPLAMNAKEVEEILDSAKKNDVFLMEVAWTRFFPASVEIRKLLAEEYIGEVKMVRADFGVPLFHVPRSDQKDLGGGALLGLGISCLQFISMVYNREKPESIQASGICLETGVDESVAVILQYSKNRMAMFTCSAGVHLHGEAFIAGTNGIIEVLSPMWCPTALVVNEKVTQYPVPEPHLPLNFTYSTGMRYEAEEVRQCLLKGLKESPVTPHAYTLLLAEMGDEIRRQVDVVYSQDCQRNMATRWGICSAGKISHDFTVALKTLPAEDHQVVAVAARKLEDAQEFSRKHNISKAYGSYEELARDPDVDVVYVGVIHPYHLSACKLFTNAKKNVLCEKPLAMNAKEVKEILDSAEKNDVFLMEAAWTRFFPASVQIRNLLAQEYIGEVKMVRADYGVPRSDQKELGGGALLDLGIYCLQFISMVYNGEKPESIQASGVCLETGVDETVAVILRYSKNRMAMFTCSAGVELHSDAIIVGTKGTIQVLSPMWCPTSLVVNRKETQQPVPEPSLSLNFTYSTGKRCEVEEVRQCLLKGLKESPVMSHAYTLLLAEMGDEICRQVGGVYSQDYQNTATKWGICSVGKISHDFTVALKTLPAEDHQVVAVAACKLEDAQEFANKHSISRVYGSYEELARDPDMGQCPSARDIVHVGVIPPYHLNACKLFINAKKNVLSEKSLAMNTKELKEILDSAKKNNVFLMEAVWTRFFQASVEIRNLLAQEYIGEVKMVRADYSLPLLHMSRSDQKDLSEGALLGLGIYCLQFISMVYKGEKPESIQARGVCLETGVDETVAVILKYSKNRMATFTCSAGVELHSEAIIIGTEGKIQVLSPMWCPTSIIVDRKETEYPIPERCLSLNFTYSTGKRYEVEEVRQCLLKGLKESPVTPHAYTLLLAEMGDEVRRQVEVVYSQDCQRNMATRWGICSAGKISHDFTVALKTLPAEDHQVVAVAARKLEDAQEFARKHNISKAYGSYEELARDPDVDVVYVGVVHPCHLNACKLFTNAKKNVLCEKPLAMNAKEVKEILDSAKKNNVFLMEAVWTRFFPASVEIRKLLAQGEIGEVKMVGAEYGVPLFHVPRSDQKDLGGGALLGLGISCLQFISMVYNAEKPESIKASGVCLETGVDETVAVILKYSKNRMATFTCSAGVELHSEAIIIGTEGKIQVLSPMWCPTSIIVDRKETEYPIPERCLSLNFTYSTGKRYEVEEVRQCLLKGLKESPVTPHAYTLLLAEMGDEVRRQVEVVYSQDCQRNMATRWGICSAGKISHDFTVALKTLPAEDHQVVAVAARKLEDAQEFARKHNISKAYGSYEELARDPDVDVVYVGVVHPCHLNACKLFTNAKKNVLCEKPLAMNAKEVKEILDSAKKNNVFLMEAAWTRFFPASVQIRNLLAQEYIGDVKMVRADYGVPRSDQKDLGGGALLDLGIFCLQFISMVYNGEKPESIQASGICLETGVNKTLAVILKYSKNRMAMFTCFTGVQLHNDAIIVGTKGKIQVPSPMWCPTSLVVNKKETQYPVPEPSLPLNFTNSTGKRYEAEEVRQCLLKGLKESPVMPHADSLLLAEMDDEIRRQVGVVYSQDCQ
ncbi:uncharacterized protein LOC103154714 isoform X5 [Poecilia formosa]|uniref:uncharacterized protein LOC103154714 isoform X5 n=1 Tax=Poecilia formosa TaxID=48698 RepID=UPI0007BA5281|nr:PREDICTED: uncharacterized protein LOC103154714 isoform X5 [Poecilia formosa]